MWKMSKGRYVFVHRAFEVDPSPNKCCFVPSLAIIFRRALLWLCCTLTDTQQLMSYQTRRQHHQMGWEWATFDDPCIPGSKIHSRWCRVAWHVVMFWIISESFGSTFRMTSRATKSIQSRQNDCDPSHSVWVVILEGSGSRADWTGLRFLGIMASRENFRIRWTWWLYDTKN